MLGLGALILGLQIQDYNTGRGSVRSILLSDLIDKRDAAKGKESKA